MQPPCISGELIGNVAWGCGMLKAADAGLVVSGQEPVLCDQEHVLVLCLANEHPSLEFSTRNL